MIVAEHGISFLSSKEQMAFKKLSDEDAQFDYLMEKTEPRLCPLWYLVVSICRCLQEGENNRIPTDAYWIGLVDEVVGTDLPCWRKSHNEPLSGPQKV
jgi:hypothetical protein